MLGQDHYLHRLRAACLAQPHRNRHQLAALDRELALSRATSTVEAYLEASGHLIGVARADALDRAANALDIALRYDDPWSAAAARLEYAHAQEGTDHAGLYAAIHRGHKEAAALRARFNALNAAFERLFLNLLHANTSHYELGLVYPEIANSMRTLQSIDPAFQPNTWIEQPRYRRRLPWSSPIVHQWLDPYWDRYAHTPALPAETEVAIEPGDWGTLEWPAASLLDAPTNTALADIYLARQSAWPDEFLAAHWAETRRVCLEARTPIAQYAVANEREAAFAVESTWNLLHLTALLAPLRAIANHGWERTAESQASIPRAFAAIEALTGLTPAEILAHPRVRHFLEHNLHPLGDGFGALAGEGGFELVRHAAAWRETGARIEFSL